LGGAGSFARHGQTEFCGLPPFAGKKRRMGYPRFVGGSRFQKLRAPPVHPVYTCHRISQEVRPLAKPNWNPKPGPLLFCNVCFPIILGAGIYSLLRSKRLLVFTWYGWLGLQAPLLALRANLAGVRHFLPAFVLYSLPDALWVYSFTFLMQSVWFRHSRSYGRTFWILLPVSLAVVAEVGQLLKVVPGTFDFMDIAGYIAAWAAATMVIRTCCRRDKLEIRA
jgi:hypothetical protein